MLIKLLLNISEIVLFLISFSLYSLQYPSLDYSFTVLVVAVLVVAVRRQMKEIVVDFFLFFWPYFYLEEQE